MLKPIILFLVIAAVARAASIEYPAPGNLRLDEGTIELWFTPMTELYVKLPPNKYQRAFSLFSLRIPEHFSMSAAWASKGTKTQVSVSMSSAIVENGVQPVVSEAPKNWQQGQRHHVAFTWRGREMKSAFDGQEAGSRKQQLPFTGSLPGRTLVIGDPEGRDCRIILHAVRVSCVARPAETIKNARPVPDIYTLLFDAFDQPPKEGRTTARVISGLSGEHGGTIKGACLFTQTPSPGLALFSSSKGAKK